MEQTEQTGNQPGDGETEQNAGKEQGEGKVQAPILTRNDQLNFKATKKAARKGQAKKKNGKQRKTNSPTTRKRKLLRSQSKRAKSQKPAATSWDGDWDGEWDDGDWGEYEEDWGVMTHPTGSSRDQKRQKRNKRDLEAHEKTTTRDNAKTAKSSKAKTAKAKTAKPGKGKTAKPAKAKTAKPGKGKTAKPGKAKTAKPGKAKAKPAPKPKAEAGNRRGRKANPGGMTVESLQSNELYSEKLVAEFRQFAEPFDPMTNVKNQSFKVEVRSFEPDLLYHRMTIYWTKGQCGVTLIETGKDVLFFSFANSPGYDPQKVAVAVRCGWIAATQQACMYALKCAHGGSCFIMLPSTLRKYYIDDMQWQERTLMARMGG